MNERKLFDKSHIQKTIFFLINITILAILYYFLHCVKYFYEIQKINDFEKNYLISLLLSGYSLMLIFDFLPKAPKPEFKRSGLNIVIEILLFVIPIIIAIVLFGLLYHSIGFLNISDIKIMPVF